MAGNGASASINLTNSQRHVNKATYAPAKLPPGAPAAPQVLEKATFARSLGVSKSEATALQGEAGGQSAEFGKTLKLVTNIAAADWPSALNRYGQALAQTSRQALVDVGEAVLQYRQAQLSMLPQSPASSVQKSARAKNVIAPSLDPARDDIAKHTALVVGVFKYHLPVQPVGALHLERLEMTPVGVEHGELVHSVPMTPGETVNIAHKEWSVTTQTFESIVNDSFEGYSETGVVDKTDLAHAFENETKHSTSLDINGSVTASYNGGAYSVTASLATDYSKKDESRNLVKDSVAHSVAITRNASARTRKEHRNTFKVSSVAGTEDLAVRTLTNQTPNAVRVDYFQLIRKWRVDLIRYGLRLTYDVVIPNPGLDLIGPVKELQEIDQWLSSASFVFDQALDAVQPTVDSWTALQTQYNVVLEPPPLPNVRVMFATTIGQKDVVFDFYGLDVPENYALESGQLNADVHGGDNIWLMVAGQSAGVPVGGTKHDQGLSPPLDLGALYKGQRGHIPIPWNGGNFNYVTFSGFFVADVVPEYQAAWRAKTYQALYDAAQTRFSQALDRAKERKAYLEGLIAGFDALTLRKMEHEEVMKWVLKWLLGDLAFDASPVSTLGITNWPDSSSPPSAPPPSTPTAAAVSAPEWPLHGIDPATLPDSASRTSVLEYGEFVKFIHNAIEWENCIYLAYPYFWDAVDNWPYKRFLLHPDPVHREFLRAGAARVVLTIRPGYEDQFMLLTQTGNPQADPASAISQMAATYVSIGQEIHNQDLTNYQNIPPANPDRTARPLLYTLQQNAWNDMQSIIGALESYHEHNGNYPPGPEDGLPATLKEYLTAQILTVPATDPPVPTFEGMLWTHLQEVSVSGGGFDDPTASFVDPWGNPYHYTTPTPANAALHGDYELVCYGSNNAPGPAPDDPLSEDITSWADGLLVAQWFEYTPTSALDVSVDPTLSINDPPLGG